MAAQHSSQYDPESLIRHFDDFGIREWERLVQTPSDEVSLHIHTYYLEKYISKGCRVLEIGAGAGRFTQVLARLGAQILVADLSNVQLELNQRFVLELGFDKAVIGWQQADICNLSQFEPGSFDYVVAYGGPFSYVLDKRDLALSECLRVLRPDGLLFFECHVALGNFTCAAGWRVIHSRVYESENYEYRGYLPGHVPGTTKQFYALVPCK